jgi:hypothetical protein
VAATAGVEKLAGGDGGGGGEKGRGKEAPEARQPTRRKPKFEEGAVAGGAAGGAQGAEPAAKPPAKSRTRRRAAVDGADQRAGAHPEAKRGRR